MPFRPPRTGWHAAAMGVLVLAVALAAQWTLRPWLGIRGPYILILPALGVAGMWWGWPAGIVVLAGGLASSLYWLEPAGQFAVTDAVNQLLVAAYLVAATILVVVGNRVHELRRRAMDAEAGLAQRLAELQRLNEVSRQQQAQLEEADRRKDEFLATLAHELRNPLAPIRQAAMIARSPQASLAQRERAHEIVERQVRHMALLLDDLLDVSRITRGKLVLRREPTPLAVLIDASVEGAGPLLAARRQQVSVSQAGEDLWLDADPMRVEQILSNLLTNAAKYGRPDGEVEVRARREGGVAVIEVRDDGIGIPPDALEAIFEMFEQLPATRGSAGGLGIGLSLSRGLAQLHGGTLAATSEGPGRGSTFTLRLPLSDRPPSSRPMPLDGLGEADGSAPPARRVMVADDNRDAAESLAEVLRMDGHEVGVAFDGHEALRLFRQMHPDVALLDIGMPGLDGHQVARALRQTPEGRRARLVAITGWGQERDLAASKESGFDAHLTKPVDPAKVLDILRSQ